MVSGMAKFCLRLGVAGGIPLASKPMTGSTLPGVNLPVILQVPNMSVVHTVSWPNANLPLCPETFASILADSAQTAVASSTAQHIKSLTGAAGSITLTSNPLTGSTLPGVNSPVIVQVPNVSAVHTVSLPNTNLSGAATTAVVAAVAEQQQQPQQVQ